MSRRDDERLAAFMAAHPTAVIEQGNLTVHVGGMPVSAPTVSDLLDKLDEIAALPGG